MAAATSEGGGGGEDASASAPPLPPSTSVSAQSRIAGAVAGALSAGPLAELVASWLSEEEEGGGDGGEEEEEQEAQERGGGGGGEGEEQRSARPLAACGACAGCGERGLTASASPPPPSCSSTPLRHIAVLHAALGASLMAFAADARALAAAAAASEKRHGGGGGGGGDEEDCSGGGEDENENSDAAASAAAALPAMADRLRFLRSVLAYHAASEDDVLMPVARRLAATAASNGGNGGGGIALSASASAAAAAAAELAAAAIAAEDHHHSTDDDDEAAGVAAAGRGAASQQQKHGGGESACLEHVGTLLNDVRARARRGGARAAVTASLASLAAAADDAASTIRAHMDAEERGVLPALQQALCHGAQAVLLWEALRSMPARVLRQLLPWLGSCLGARAARELVGDACVGAAAPRRGRGGAGGAAAAQRAEARLLRSWCEGLERLGGGGGGGGGGEEDELLLSPPPPSPPGEEAGEEEERKESAAQPGTRKVAATPATAAAATTSDGDAPIDHIFQFHKALRRDLRAMEWQVAAFADALDAVGGSGWRRAKEGEGGAGEEEEEANGAAGAPAAENDSNSGDASPAAARALEGRFRFLQGVYKAHSDAEDNIVFPALEAREALRRVSHAYTLDHEQESALFAEVERHLLRLRGASTLAEARAAARDLAARTAALRASLETHVTAEERELWPLFAENFSAEEQEALVGTIVGRTGAEVLAATLPWVAAATTPREAAAMWESLRSAARGTAFDDWLRASRTVRDSDAPPPPSAADASAPASGAAGLLPASPGRNKPGRAAQPGDALDAVVEYLGLATKGADGGADGFAAGAAVGGDDAAATATPATTSATYRPGWEAIFTMNQAQLESAVRAAWTDESLEPARRAYLAQNIMAARFVVSQQRRASSAQQQRRKEESDGAAAAPSSCGRSHSHQQQQQHQRVSDPAAKAHAASPPPPLPCPHYSRRTRVVAPCCARAHGCRHCHDEAEDHKLVPSQVSSILCAHCGVEGPAGAECSSCGRRQARYYCAICRLWDDTPGRDIYHCPFCNLCRLGKGLGVDAQHCMRCNACMALAEHASHACRRLPEACPACAEPLFDSPRPYRQFPCGECFVCLFCVCECVFLRRFLLSFAILIVSRSFPLLSDFEMREREKKEKEKEKKGEGKNLRKDDNSNKKDSLDSKKYGKKLFLLPPFQATTCTRTASRNGPEALTPVPCAAGRWETCGRTGRCWTRCWRGTGPPPLPPPQPWKRERMPPAATATTLHLILPLPSPSPPRWLRKSSPSSATTAGRKGKRLSTSSTTSVAAAAATTRLCSKEKKCQSSSFLSFSILPSDLFSLATRPSAPLLVICSPLLQFDCKTTMTMLIRKKPTK